MRRDGGSHGGERRLEVAGRFETARLGDAGGFGPWRRRCGRGAKGGRRIGSQIARQVEVAEPHLGVDQIWLQGHRGLVTRHRHRFLAKASKFARGRCAFAIACRGECVSERVGGRRPGRGRRA